MAKKKEKSFVERKLAVLNAIGTAKASRAMTRVIARNQGGSK